jgi:hypothetical protein
MGNIKWKRRRGWSIKWIRRSDIKKDKSKWCIMGKKRNKNMVDKIIWKRKIRRKKGWKIMWSKKKKIRRRWRKRWK